VTTGTRTSSSRQRRRARSRRAKALRAERRARDRRVEAAQPVTVPTTDTATATGRSTPRRHARGRRRALTILFVLALAAILAATIAAWRRGGIDDFIAGASENHPPATSPAPATTAAPTTTAPAAATALPPVIRTPTADQPLDVWFMGDSTAYAIGSQLEALDTEGLLHVELRYTTSSGLARSDFFDWGATVLYIQDNSPPEAMILSIGANDAQPLVDPAGNVIDDVYGDAWLQEYERRVEELARRVIAKNTRLYLIGQPIARSETYTVFVNRLNTALRAVAERYDEVVFIDIYDLFRGPDGAYTDTMPGPDGQPQVVRRSDGIHLTTEGGAIAAPAVMDALRTDWER
jgi:uncharacterized protein